MSVENFVSWAESAALLLVIIAFLLTVARLVLGPSLPDRVLALDMLATVGIGFIAIVAIATGFDEYLDVAIALALVGFLATVAFARYILIRGLRGEAVVDETGPQRRSIPRINVLGRRKEQGQTIGGEGGASDKEE